MLAGEKIDFAVSTNGRGVYANTIELRATLSTDSPASAAPVPASVVILGTGGLFLLGRGWRRGRRDSSV